MVDQLHRIFAANQTVILFVYGQVFFVLGLAIALQSWRHSRLVLARSLHWLAGFGFAHAFYEWGDIFIPLQSEYLPVPYSEFLLTLQLLLVATSFAFLFQFGVETLRPLSPRLRWLRYVPLALACLWCFWSFALILPRASTMAIWRLWSNIGARYALGLPGGLLAAYALLRQDRTIALIEHTGHISRYLRVAAGALAAYAILAGLLTRPAGFFPANTVNIARLEALIVIPVPLLRSLVGLTLTVAAIRTLEVFRAEVDRRLSEMEEAQVLAAERDRIGRELHDGTVQTIYAAGLLLQATQRELRATGAQAHAAATRLDHSMGLLDRAVSDIRKYIGMLRATPGRASLSAGLHELAAEYGRLAVAEVSVRIDLPEICPLPPAAIGHVLSIANEALSNVARHSRARHVQLSATVIAEQLHLAIIDDGLGLASDYVPGYGLDNMRERARLLRGEIVVTSRQGHGTELYVDLPWSTEGRLHA